MQWAPDGHCGSTAFNCLLRVCRGSRVHFKDLRITGLNAPDYAATLCLDVGTSVKFTNATFKDNMASFIGVTSGEVCIMLEGGTWSLVLGY